MTVEEFNYDLPEELIAQTPLKKRDESRLMVLNKNTGERREANRCRHERRMLGNTPVWHQAQPEREHYGRHRDLGVRQSFPHRMTYCVPHSSVMGRMVVVR